MRRAWKSIIRAAGLVPEIIEVQVRHGLLDRLRRRPFFPRAIHYIATHRCNARCAMCGIWKDHDAAVGHLSVSELTRIVEDRLFSRLEYIGISGGEPFLRGDLQDLVAVFLERCSHAKRISITTNGLVPAEIGRVIPAIAEGCRRRSTLLDVSVSCHAVGDLADRIYGVPGAFGRIAATLEILKSRERAGDLSVSLNCVLLKENLEHAEELLQWAETQGLSVGFVVGEQRSRFHNDEMAGALITSDQRPLLLSFLRRLERLHRASTEGLKYRALADVMEGKPRAVSCYYALSGLLLGFDGSLYYCSHSAPIGNCRQTPPSEIFYAPENLEYRRLALLSESCPKCPPYTLTRLELEKDIVPALGFLVKEKLGGKKSIYRVQRS